MERSKFFIAVVFGALLMPLIFLTHFSIYFTAEAGFSFFSHIGSALLVFLIYVGSFWIQVASHTNNNRQFFSLALALGFFCLTAVLFHLFPISFTRFIGAPAIYLIFANLLANLLAYVFNKGFWPSFAAISLLILVPVVTPTHHPIKTSERTGNRFNDPDAAPQCMNGTEAACAFAIWLSKRPDLERYKERGLPYPVFVVTAAGGGIYAAANTYSFLRHLSDRCPSFRQHVFAISSVSGGGFGSAAFSLKSDHGKPVTSFPNCQEPGPSKPTPFSIDAFSPILGAFIFGNIVEAYMPFHIGLAGSGEMLSTVFEDQLTGTQFTENIENSWRPSKTNPAMFFNVVDVLSGAPEIIAPFGVINSRTDFFYDSKTAFAYRQAPTTMTIANAASASARFPFVTPSAGLSASLKTEEGQVVNVEKVYVDGGYFDNSGVALVRTLLSGLMRENTNLDREERSCGSSVTGNSFCGYNLRIVGDHNSGCSGEEDALPCAKEFWSNNVVPTELALIQIDSSAKEPRLAGQSFFDPLRALLNMRTNRAPMEKANLIFDQCGPLACHDVSSGILTHTFINDKSQVPLSWSMGLGGDSIVRSSIGDPILCGTGDASQQTRNELIIDENNCAVKNIVELIEGRAIDGL